MIKKALSTIHMINLKFGKLYIYLSTIPIKLSIFVIILWDNILLLTKNVFKDNFKPQFECNKFELNTRRNFSTSYEKYKKGIKFYKIINQNKDTNILSLMLDPYKTLTSKPNLKRALVFNLRLPSCWPWSAFLQSFYF